ncbi:unnamed protein product [Cuscuta campestris]|uniref:Reverse transcriptase Ty1/copia-type domain-containing protein n=1 Tax=Cuscuta campestris TaxID=132261 RepID=A0A484L405_9ASTE|nr:unnamed protein product [Cuscuta campestris]
MALVVATTVPLGVLTAATEDEDVAAVVVARINGNPPDLKPGSSPTPHQTQFIYDILERAGMVSCKPASTPVDTRGKRSASAGPPAPDPTLYQSIVGALQYLTFTRPDITYAVQQLCLFLHDPRLPHVTAMKRYADIFTKGLPTMIFTEFRDSLGIRKSLPVPLGAC